MNWLLFYLLAALHPVAFLVIALKCNTWKLRFILWALLPLPAIWYCWDYYAIKNEHAQMCAAEGGLKVFIQPEKADRVRFVGVGFRNQGAAKGTLRRHYPSIQVSESLAGEYDGTDGAGQPYVAYTLVSNPKAGLPMDIDPWKEPALIYSQTPIGALDRAIYEINQLETKVPHGTSKVTTLSRDGKAYAKYTELVHWWTGIQYPDALPTWRCPDQRSPDAEVLPYEPLVKLILK